MTRTKILDDQESWYVQDRTVTQVWLIEGHLVGIHVEYYNDDRTKSRAWAYSLDILEGQPVPIVETNQCHWWLKVSARPVPLNSPKPLGEEAALDVMREVANDLADRVGVIYRALEPDTGPLGNAKRPEGPGDVTGRIGR